MVKIRLRRMGNRHRPFYRIVVAKSTAARDGSFIESIGTYDTLKSPSEIKIDAERAMHWLMEGAQPTETVGYILNREGILADFFSKRPNAKKKYAYLDKRTAAVTQKTAVGAAPSAEAESETEAGAEA